MSFCWVCCACPLFPALPVQQKVRGERRREKRTQWEQEQKEKQSMLSSQRCSGKECMCVQHGGSQMNSGSALTGPLLWPVEGLMSCDLWYALAPLESSFSTVRMDGMILFHYDSVQTSIFMVLIQFYISFMCHKTTKTKNLENSFFKLTNKKVTPKNIGLLSSV